MSSPATMPLPLIHARSVANTAMIATPIVNSIVRGRSRHSRRGGVREFIEITRLLLYGRNPDRIKRIELLLRGVPARRFGDRLARNRGGLGHHVNARSKCGPDGFSFPLVRLTTTYLLWIYRTIAVARGWRRVSLWQASDHVDSARCRPLQHAASQTDVLPSGKAALAGPAGLSIRHAADGRNQTDDFPPIVLVVTPAQATRRRESTCRSWFPWMPAFAGMTEQGHGHQMSDCDH